MSYVRIGLSASATSAMLTDADCGNTEATPPMPDRLERLRATLAELHQELADLDDSEPQVRALLEGAVADLQAAIDEHGPRLAQSLEPHARASLLDRLRQAWQHYNESHPATAASLGSVIDVLGRMGL
jgi:hypothetical protein